MSIKISLKFLSNGPIDYITALVQIMAWRRPGDKPLSEPMMIMCFNWPQWVNPQRLEVVIIRIQLIAIYDNAAKPEKKYILCIARRHPMETNCRHGTIKNWYFCCCGHICSAITTFVICCYISKMNVHIITRLVSNVLFSWSGIPMETYKT